MKKVILPFAILASLALGQVVSADSSEQLKKDRIVVEALMRLDGVNVQKEPKLAASVQRYLNSIQDDPAQLKVIRKLGIQGMSDHLLDKALTWGATTESVQAVELAVEQGAKQKIQEMLSVNEPDEKAIALSRVVALSNRRELLEIQEAMLQSVTVNKAIKVEAAVALSRNKSHHDKLVQFAKDNKLPNEAKILIGSTLRNSPIDSVKSAASELFPPIKSTQSNLPPIEALVKRRGNAAEGKILYNGVATCSQCHVVGTEGKNVGPALTEIGNKLSKDAMYVAILAPSAGISHNYESFILRTEDDEVITGLLVSDTADAITLKDAKGIERTIPKANIEEYKKQEKSLMPENLQELMSEQGLVDLVEYLMTLKK